MPSDTPPTRTIRYAAGETGVVDVWSPSGAALDVTVALVHGGFWRAAYDRHHLEPLAAALVGDGFHVASVEYPRIGMPGGGWPGTGTSVLAALRAVAEDIALPDSVVAVGHSAGGHLVTWAGSIPAPPRSSPSPADPIVPVAAPPEFATEKYGSAGDISPADPYFSVAGALAGVVSLAGVVDLALAARMNLGAGAAQALMGAADEATWAAADPARLRLGVPTVLLTGDVDEDVPHGLSESYLATRTSDDAACELRLLPGVGHMDLVDPGHPAYDELVRAVRDLNS